MHIVKQSKWRMDETERFNLLFIILRLSKEQFSAH